MSTCESCGKQTETLVELLTTTGRQEWGCEDCASAQAGQIFGYGTGVYYRQTMSGVQTLGECIKKGNATLYELGGVLQALFVDGQEQAVNGGVAAAILSQ